MSEKDTNKDEAESTPAASTTIFGNVATTTDIKQTTNQELQSALVVWTLQLDQIKTLAVASTERKDALLDFVRSFAPGDVDEGDIIAFADQLSDDTEFFDSMHRELHQCANGQNVESIAGGQINQAIFTLKPLDGQLAGGGSALDIVREVSFIADPAAGGNWRAEG
jgi:hypothetical protein